MAMRQPWLTPWQVGDGVAIFLLAEADFDKAAVLIRAYRARQDAAHSEPVLKAA
jgi:hypothetical protein